MNYLEGGKELEPGDNILESKGDLKLFFRLWRVFQTFLSVMCAIAGKTSSLMSASKKENPDLIIAATRKTHPGARRFELKAIRAGGGHPQELPQWFHSDKSEPSSCWETEQILGYKEK